MKKTLKIVLIVFVILAVLVSVVAIWQWDNIKSVYIALNSTPEKIDNLIKQNETKTDEILEKITDVKMRPLTDDERKMLESGELSKEDAIKLINGERNEEEQSEKISEADKKASKKRIDDIIARIYLLRAEYLNALSSLEAEAKATASSIPKKDRTTSKKLELIEKFTGRGVALEGQCDSKMERLLAELKSELERSGLDMTVISEIKSVYASEKQLKKSELFSKYNRYR
ncbi:MAG: hypothetical protein E7404_04910 [Ruminococcaceae bacterium]|nr:hypothetical protein [Oscillospiraceae bacterium]